MIADAVAELRRDLALPVRPEVRGPVPLEAFFEGLSAPRIVHVEVPGLTRGKVQSDLQSRSILVEDLGDDEQELEGFLFSTGRAAWAFVNVRNKTLGRQRFTAAHELGHVVLHRDRMGRYIADETITENADGDNTIEVEANRFAAELLMPAAVCQARAQELKELRKCCPRQVLAYRLAAELLVSREAMRYRLNALEIGDE
jgi:hypothetical protein